MTTKQYLSQIVRFDMMIRNKFEEIIKYRVLVESITPKNDDERVQTSLNGDKIGGFVSKIVDLESEIERLHVTRNKIIKQIECLPEPFMYQIIYLVFVEDYDIMEMGRKLNYSKSKTYRLYNESIEKFEELFGKTYLNKSKKSA